MGRPMASTEPNATTRITMAKARPSDLGGGLLELAEGGAAELDLQAVDGREDLLEGATDGAGLLPVVAGDLEVGEGDLAGLGAVARRSGVAALARRGWRA